MPRGHISTRSTDGITFIEAEGGTRFLHMETVGRSRSPWGPFEGSPWNPWVSQHISWDDQEKSLGHCDVVDTAAGDWWTVCLGTRHFNSQTLDLGRETFLFPVTWKDGWPTITAEETQTLAVRRPTLPQHLWPREQARDDFNEGQLGLEWNAIGPLGVENSSLKERPGYLRLHGQPDRDIVLEANSICGTSANGMVDHFNRPDGVCSEE